MLKLWNSKKVLVTKVIGTLLTEKLSLPLTFGKISSSAEKRKRSDRSGWKINGHGTSAKHNSTEQGRDRNCL